MKTLSLPTFRLTSLLAAAALLLAPSALAQNDASAGTTARVKFSDPAKPGTLTLSIPWAEIRISGTDGDEVVVTSTLNEKGRGEVDDDGFRRLDADSSFELVEQDNIASIRIVGENIWAAHGAEFAVQVPRKTRLVLRTQAGGDILVEGVEGDLDINSMNGEVRLRDLTGSAVVNTMNGEISATFKRAPNKPVSFSTMNGEIDVRLPADTKANLRMRTHNGSIRTNFPESMLQARPEKSAGTPAAAPAAPSADGREVAREVARETARLNREQAEMARTMAREMAQAAKEIARATAEVAGDLNLHGIPVAPVPPVPPVPGFGRKTITGTLNGGGVDITLTSMNGTITLREAK